MICQNGVMFTGKKYRNLVICFESRELTIHTNKGDGKSKLLITSNTNTFRNKYTTIYESSGSSVVYSTLGNHD